MSALRIAGLLIGMLVLPFVVAVNGEVHLQVAAVQTQPERSRPNIILITLDTVRADHLSVYGYRRNTTPYLSALARDATVFTNAIAAGDMSLTSHGAIFSGVYASWNGAHIFSDHVVAKGTLLTTAKPISNEIPTLPEILSQHGYSTMAVVANTGFLLPVYGFARGFEYFDATDVIQKKISETKGLEKGNAEESEKSVCTETARFRPAEEINLAAFRLLNSKRISGRPFFLFLNYMDAHDPYLSPAPFNTMFPYRDCSLSQVDFLSLYRGLAEGEKTLSQSYRQHYISQYDGAIAYIDDQIGKLMMNLKRIGLYQNSLIIIVGDHGEALGERGLVGHALSVDEDQVHVPLIVKYPGTRARHVVSEIVSHTDLLPTILDITHLGASPLMQGRSLMGNPASSREILTESFPNPLLASPTFDRIERALYTGSFKYVWSTEGKRELYNISSDPNEAHDLCAIQTDQCANIQRRLETWIETANVN